MLQAQQRVGVRGSPRTSQGAGSVAVGSRTSDGLMSQSTANRKALLGQSYYEDAKKAISQALTSDEAGDRMEALELYNKSLSLIRTGLASMRSSVGLGTRDDSTALHEMRSKMEKMKDQIKSRMEVLLQMELEERALSRSTARQTTSSTATAATTTSKTGLTSSVAGRVSVSSTAASVSGGRGSAREEVKADMLFNVDKGIALFEVDSKEHVRKFEDVDALSVFQYKEKIKGQPPAFLQCGGFVYPLIPGKSPILKTSDRVYMFPELKNDDGSTVGVALDSASDEEVSRLDTLLGQLANLKTVDITATVEREREREGGVVSAEDKAPPTWGATVAGGIDKGVSWMSTKITQGTEVAGNLIIAGATKLREKIEPNEKPTEIPESVQKGVHYTRKATGYVVGVSDFLMTSLAKLTVKVGKGVKDVVAESETVKNMEINPHAVEAWKATKSGLKGAAVVFTDLERGAVAVVKSMGRESSKTIGHKYGEDAGKVADDSMTAAAHGINLAYTYWSWKTWGIRFIGKVGEVIASDTSKEKNAGSKTETSTSKAS